MRKVMLRDIQFWLHDTPEALSGAIDRTRDFWESDILDYIRDTHPRHESILDIGANIGNHAVYFANYLKYDAIMCFEPDQENYWVLEKNMAPYNRIGLVRMAASNKTGSTLLYRNSSNWGAHEINENEGEFVRTMTVDKIGLSRVTLMKIDVERHEPQVIEGATDTIIRCRPLILIEDAELEYHKLLEPLGYEIERGWEHHKTYLWRSV